jgi:heterodisulfide reductase subunit B
MYVCSLGAENVYYPFKVKCCGGMLMTTYEDVALKLNKEIVGLRLKTKLIALDYLPALPDER